MRGYDEETGGIRILGRPRHSGEKNIEMGFKETDLEGLDWIHLAWDNDM
jgi:hypothetical protein